jgi:uncharacterized protein
MKIDMYPHILTPRYFQGLNLKGQGRYRESLAYHGSIPASVNLDIRFKAMDEFPDVVHVLTMSAPPVENLVPPQEAAELCRIGNDELAGLVAKYPARFPAAVACLPMNDIDAAMKETERAITQLKFKGVQIYTNMNGIPLDDARFKPLFKLVAGYDFPIWLHCWDSPIMGPPTADASPQVREWVKDPYKMMIGWDFETSLAMVRLVNSGVFRDNPGIKIITHHLGGMIPMLEGRVKNFLGESFADMKLFYNDTAVSASIPALMCGHALFGADRILFGTDEPFPRQATKTTIEAIEGMPVPAEEKEKIFEKNARRLLGF